MGERIVWSLKSGVWSRRAGDKEAGICLRTSSDSRLQTVYGRNPPPRASKWRSTMEGTAMEQAVRMSERMTEAQIIEACKTGDRSAFHALFEIYKDRVY